MEEQTHRKELVFFNNLINRRHKSHNQAAQYPPIPSWFIPEYRKKNPRNAIQYTYTSRSLHSAYLINII